MDIEAILAISFIFGVIPLTGIFAGVYLRSLKIRAKGEAAGFLEEDLEELRRLADENDELRKRIENLETIVVEKDSQMLSGLQEDEDRDTSTEQRKIPYRDMDVEF